MYVVCGFCLIFFFKQKTAYELRISDWSSDVCSSDLTFDVIVTPTDERAYTIVGEAVDRSGLARATLAPREGMAAEVPPLRSRPVATMKDMGMDMSGMDMAGASGGTNDLSKPDGDMVGMEHGAMGQDMAGGGAGGVG